MSTPETRVLTAVDIQQQAERLRQETETFNQLRKQDAQWFALRIVTGSVALVMFPTIFVFCAWILRNSSLFDRTVVIAASSALFVDILGMVIAAWKILLNPQTQGQLKPVTDKPLPRIDWPVSVPALAAANPDSSGDLENATVPLLEAAPALQPPADPPEKPASLHGKKTRPGRKARVDD